MATPCRDRSPSLPPLFIDERSRINDSRRISSAVATPVVAQFDLDDAKENDAEGVPGPGPSRKRKRASDVDDSVSLLGSSFTITPRSHSTKQNPIKFYPVLVIPRDRISLGMLDFHQVFDDIPAARRFEAPDLRIVDLETRRSGTPHVLVAVSQKRRIFVLDACDEPGIFALCQLGYWVKLPDLTDLATICNHRLADKLRVRQEEKAKERERHLAAIRAKKTAKDAVKRPPLSRSVSDAGRSFSVKDIIERPISRDSMATPPTSDGTLTRPGVTRASVSAPNSVPVMPVVLIPSEPQATTAESDALPFANAPPTSESIFDGLRTQYWEILYKSLGPLTYFAKGPLSRARAAFKLGTQNDGKMSDLVTFLRGLIMTTAQLDSKYRYRIPEIIREMKGFYLESEDNGATSRRKKRRNRKMKLGKDGLFPYEDAKIREWWRNNMPDLKEDSIVTEATVKSYASLLRTRETQLQLIIILEALALEPEAEAEENAKAQSLLPGDIAVSVEDNNDSQKTNRKSKKQDLATLADLLADRLGIWQSTISDELRFIESAQLSKMSADPSKHVEAPVEPLKDFCVDVIVPFFAKRLPVVCHAISKKLGGPSILKQEKEDALQPEEPSSAIKPKQTPGAATKRTAAPRSSKSKPITFEQRIKSQLAKGRQTARRSLSLGPRQKIQSMMAAQPREIPGLKKETSEMKAARLKAAEGNGLMKAPGLSRSQSMVTSFEDPKAAKRAMLDAELHDAISGIRKPNRDATGRIIRDEVERRTGSGLSQIKKQRKPQRKVPSSSPQVIKATPMRARYRDMSQHSAQSQRYYGSQQSQYIAQRQTQSFHQDHSRYEEDDDDVIHPSSIIIRPGAHSFPAPSYHSRYDSGHDQVVDETPAKPRFRSFSVGPGFQSGIAEKDEDGGDTQPFDGHEDSIGETPAKPLSIRATPARGAGGRTIHLLRTPGASNTDDPFAETADLNLSPLVERKSARRSGGVKGLLFPRSGGSGKSGPMEFKSPSRATRAGAGAQPVLNSVENSPTGSPNVVSALPKLSGVTPRGGEFSVVASSLPFASATARSLAAKFSRPGGNAAGVRRQELGKQMAMEFSPLKKSFAAPMMEPESPVKKKARPILEESARVAEEVVANTSIYAQLGWDDDF